MIIVNLGYLYILFLRGEGGNFGIPSRYLMLYDVYYSMYEYESNVREKVYEFHINVQ